MPNPGTCPAGWSLGAGSPQSHPTQVLGAPQDGGAACAPVRAWPPLHLHHPLPTYSGRGSPKTPQTSPEVMPLGLGHLILLEVSLDRDAVPGVQCPQQGQPQDAEHGGLHGKGEPRAGGRELCSAGEFAEPLFKGRR